MKTKTFIFSLIFLVCAAFPVAAKTRCNLQYLNGRAPYFLNGKLTVKTLQICYLGYDLIYSGVTRTPMTSAEHLTRQRLTVRHPRRVNAFHPDPNITAADRSELKDYARSGYDRGHMAPSGDMATAQEQEESFSLGNMVPQNHNNNTQLWEGIEAATRALAKHDGELYTVTGPIFYGSLLKRINGRVLVPTYIYKAVYDPRRNQAAAYLVKNAPGMHYAVISIAELESLSGIDPFPSLPENVKQKAMELPAPRAHSRHPGIQDPRVVPHKTS
jgi:endonuclease G